MSIVWMEKDKKRGVLNGKIEPSGQPFSFRYEGNNRGRVISAYSIPPWLLQEIVATATMQE